LFHFVWVLFVKIPASIIALSFLLILALQVDSILSFWHKVQHEYIMIPSKDYIITYNRQEPDQQET